MARPAVFHDSEKETSELIVRMRPKSWSYGIRYFFRQSRRIGL